MMEDGGTGESEPDSRLRLTALMVSILDWCRKQSRYCIRPSQRETSISIEYENLNLREAGRWNLCAINLHTVASFTPMRSVLDYREAVVAVLLSQ
jgi:hypothetical protein